MASPAHLNAPVVGIAAAASGQGYILVASDGGVFTYGVGFHGSVPGSLAAGQQLVAPIVGIAVTHSGNGYWEVGADGGVFNYGDAPFLGSIYTAIPGQKLNGPIVGIQHLGVRAGLSDLRFASDLFVRTFGPDPVRPPGRVGEVRRGGLSESGCPDPIDRCDGAHRLIRARPFSFREEGLSARRGAPTAPAAAVPGLRRRRPLAGGGRPDRAAVPADLGAPP